MEDKNQKSFSNAMGITAIVIGLFILALFIFFLEY